MTTRGAATVDAFRRYLEERPFFFAPVRGAEVELMRQADLSESPILDLGCGDGFFTSQLTAQSTFIGLDPDLKSVRQAAGSSAYRALVTAEAGRMPFRADSFAAVMSNSVLEHIPNLEEAVAEIHRVLRPGGRLVITVPSHTFGDMLLGTGFLRRAGLAGLSSAYKTWFNGHSRHFHTDSAAVWIERLRKQGLEVKRYHYYISREGLQAFDAAHYLSIGRLISYRLTGKWVLFRLPLVTRIMDAWLRKYGDPSPVSEGAYLFVVAQKL